MFIIHLRFIPLTNAIVEHNASFSIALFSPVYFFGGLRKFSKFRCILVHCPHIIFDPSLFTTNLELSFHLYDANKTQTSTKADI